MNDELEDDETIDSRLERLDEDETELTVQGMLLSARRVSNEIRRIAKSEQKLIPYIQATFSLMNNSPDLLDPIACRDYSLEIIGLLESEELARAIEPNLPEAEYQHCVNWYSACGYDNLAKATALLNGHNSDGMHACIADGIEVCRRTGKTQCVTCFREYATSVYEAADDIDMALHYAQVGVANENRGPHDRRWAGAQDLVELSILEGRLKSAVEQVDQLIEFSEIWHTPRRAKLITRCILKELGVLIGQPERWRNVFADQEPPPNEEFPYYEWRRDRADALAACASGQAEQAIEQLTVWDRELTRRKNLDHWFRNRLRLLAAHRVANHAEIFDRLAAQLETKAKTARDWLTLRCLARLRNPSTPVTPFPFAGDVDSGPYQHASAPPMASADIGNESSPPSEGSSEAEPAEQSDSPQLANAFLQRISEAHASADGEANLESKVSEILADILAVSPQTELSDLERRGLISVVAYALGDGNRAKEIWDWANAMAVPIPNDAVAMSLLAKLGAGLLFDFEAIIGDRISEPSLREMFERSLQIDPNHSRNFGRAGDFFRFTENIGEAERCYARGFRLDRCNADIAQNLSRIYRATERERDGLAVLDMAIRNGADDPSLCWSAALLAYKLKQYESSLTYLDGYQKVVVEQPWVQYYRSCNLLRLNRPQEALSAILEESRVNEGCQWVLALHQAAAHALLGDHDQFTKMFDVVMSTQLAAIDYLTVGGISESLELLLDCLGAQPQWKAEDERLTLHVISAGVIPDDFWIPHREQHAVAEGVSFFRCHLRQPLDDRWQNWPTRMPDEDAAMAAYETYWGVLAMTPEQASELALEWQNKTFPLPSEVVEIECHGSNYRDHIGVVWQGYREPTSSPPDE